MEDIRHLSFYRKVRLEKSFIRVKLGSMNRRPKFQRQIYPYIVQVPGKSCERKVSVLAFFAKTLRSTAFMSGDTELCYVFLRIRV